MSITFVVSLHGAHCLLRPGLCHKSSFDTKFSWDSQQLVNGRHSFNGFTDSYLTWDASNARWMLKVMSDSGVFATHNESDYPLGTRLWNITNDGCGVTGLAYLSLSTCTEDHFNCNDGGCVDLNSKCDGVNDCHDRSDEHNCNLIFVDKSYLKVRMLLKVHCNHSRAPHCPLHAIRAVATALTQLSIARGILVAEAHLSSTWLGVDVVPLTICSRTLRVT